MDNNSKLSIYRGQLDSLVNNIFDEYLNLETNSTIMIDSLNKQLDSLKDDYNSMLNSIKADHDSNVESLKAEHDSNVESLKAEHDSNVESLKATVDTVNLDNSKKDKLITELQQKVTSFTQETSENKFDIIRGQAKEIAAKDKEIIRLREELVKAKEGIMDKQVTMDKKNIGWSPTSSPTPALPVEEVKLYEPVNVSKDEGSDSDSDEEYEMITYRKNNYYMCKNKVYEIIKDEEGDDDVGECVGDWVKQKSGKFKLVKN